MPRLPHPQRAAHLVAAALCLLSIASACGGRSDTEEYLFGADNGSGADGATGTGASNGSGANGSGANGTGASGGTGPIGEGGFDGGGTATGGTGGSGVAGSGMAGSPSGPQVSCGADSCDTSKEFCCAGLGGFGCLPKGSECGGAVLTCSQGGDCPGNTVCCLKVIGDVGGESQCKASCVNMRGPGRERQLCSRDDECPFDHCRATVFGLSWCTRP